jgi:DNA-binding HxlR family transcriptional regulator
MKMNALPEEQDELMQFMKSLADAERLKIAGLLGVEPLTTNQLAERLGMKPSEVAHHLEVLAANGLAHKEGHAYRLDSQALEKLTRKVLALSHPPAPQYEGDEFTVKTLRAYLSGDGTLKGIPSQHKKLMVILEHLVKNFEPGVQYPESQVNQILRRFHDDTATLRRSMVDNGLLKREKGMYWRAESQG